MRNGGGGQSSCPLFPQMSVPFFLIFICWTLQLMTKSNMKDIESAATRAAFYSLSLF